MAAAAVSSSHLLALTNRRVVSGRRTSAPFPPPRSLRRLLVAAARAAEAGGETGPVAPPSWLRGSRACHWAPSAAVDPEWRPVAEGELGHKKLDWWNLVRGLIGLRDRHRRCLYWLLTSSSSRGSVELRELSSGLGGVFVCLFFIFLKDPLGARCERTLHPLGYKCRQCNNEHTIKHNFVMLPSS